MEGKDNGENNKRINGVNANGKEAITKVSKRAEHNRKSVVIFTR